MRAGLRRPLLHGRLGPNKRGIGRRMVNWGKGITRVDLAGEVEVIMGRQNIEQRVAALERNLAELTRTCVSIKRNWFEDIWASFDNDPAFDRAMRYGRQWRKAENLKPSV